MKNQSAIRQKLKQLRFRYLKKRLEHELSAAPSNCVHNQKFDAGTGGQEYGVCLIDDPVLHRGRQGSVCDEAFGGCARAERCPRFLLRKTKEVVKDEFYRELRESPLHQIASEMPDMAALLWVLQDGASDDLDPQEFDEPTEPTPLPVVEDIPPALVAVAVDSLTPSEIAMAPAMSATFKLTLWIQNFISRFGF